MTRQQAIVAVYYSKTQNKCNICFVFLAFGSLTASVGKKHSWVINKSLLWQKVNLPHWIIFGLKLNPPFRQSCSIKLLLKSNISSLSLSLCLSHSLSLSRSLSQSNIWLAVVALGSKNKAWRPWGKQSKQFLRNALKVLLLFSWGTFSRKTRTFSGIRRTQKLWMSAEWLGQIFSRRNRVELKEELCFWKLEWPELPTELSMVLTK